MVTSEKIIVLLKFQFDIGPYASFIAAALDEMRRSWKGSTRERNALSQLFSTPSPMGRNLHFSTEVEGSLEEVAAWAERVRSEVATTLNGKEINIAVRERQTPVRCVQAFGGTRRMVEHDTESV